MDVTKIDVPSQILTTQDNSAPDDSNPSTDLFFNLISQTVATTNPPPKNNDKTKVDMLDSDKIQNSIDTPDNLDIENGALLAQLNMLNTLNQPIKPPEKMANTNINPDVTSFTVQSSQLKSATTVMNQTSSVKTTPAISDDQTVHDENLAADLMKTNNTSPIPIAEPVMMQSATVPKKLANQEVELNVKQKHVTADKTNSPIDAIQQNVETPSTAAEKPINQPINQPDTQNGVPTKYMDAFAQLGNLINSQTAPHLARQKLVPDFSVEQLDYSAKTSNIQQAANETKIELSGPSISSFMKEGYDAKIKIYPPELGNVTAKLRVDKNNANLVILTENNHVKGIVEANLPKLFDSFQQAGINLTNIQVQTAMSDSMDNKNSQQEGQRNFESYSVKEYANELNNQQTVAPEEEKKSLHTIIDTYA